MENKFEYTPLKEPILITEQEWSGRTLPLVATSTNTYNHAPYIRDCIEGILMQRTTFPVRVVIFDDCSTDDTREIVQEYEAKYPQLIKGIYPKKNTWKKPERNEALQPRNEARNKAKYIALCEGDDYWTDPLKLQRQVEFMEANPDYSLCYHSFKTQIGDKLSNETYPKRGLDYTADELIGTPAGIMNASKLYINFYSKENFIPPPRYGGDYFLNAYLGLYGNCKFINSIGPCVRRIHQGGVWSSKDSTAKVFGVINTKIKVYNYFMEMDDYHRMALSLAAINQTIEKKLPAGYCTITHPNLRLTYKGVGFIVLFSPILSFLKGFLNRFRKK